MKLFWCATTKRTAKFQQCVLIIFQPFFDFLLWSFVSWLWRGFWLQRIWSVNFNSFMHNVEQWQNILQKSSGFYTARFLKHVWQFFIIMHESVEKRTKQILTHLDEVELLYPLPWNKLEKLPRRSSKKIIVTKCHHCTAWK